MHDPDDLLEIPEWLRDPQLKLDLRSESDMKIVTEYVYPPIPDRSCDWSAVDDDTYDGAPDSNCPIGRGATEAEAIRDLKQQFADHEVPCACGGTWAEHRPGCLPEQMAKIWPKAYPDASGEQQSSTVVAAGEN